ncbi:MAG: DUF2461 domain-containing protein [Ignavibacteria bacterium]|nr:DUF2461 domain-containing protein [Ignavibacteria bacterium]
MNYFNTSFLDFFKELSANNSTDWFNEHRKTYETEVKKPFASFVAEMITRIQKYEPAITIQPSDAIMRINKDIRFSKDKTPYNTYVAANISLYGKKDKSYPGFYFQLSDKAIEIFGGAYMVEPPMLHSIRTYIAGHLEEFSAAYNDPQFKQKFGTILGEKHKRVPEEFQSIVTQEPLIANKQFYYAATVTPDYITSNELPEKMIEYYLAAKKVNEFLQSSLKK